MSISSSVTPPYAVSWRDDNRRTETEERFKGNFTALIFPNLKVLTPWNFGNFQATSESSLVLCSEDNPVVILSPM